jgi:hypothetical protein
MNIQFWSENLKGRDHLEGLGVDGRIMSPFIFQNKKNRLMKRIIRILYKVGECELDSSDTGYWSIGGLL